MFVGICGAILCAQSSLISVVTFTSLARPFRMPPWPLSPVIALVGVGLALSQQKSSDLIICAAIFGGGLICYLVFLRPRSNPYWTHMVVPERQRPQ